MLVIFWITSVKNWLILVIFCMLNPEKTWHEHLTHLSTSPVRCSHSSLGNLEKNYFDQKINSIIYAYFRLIALSRKKDCNLYCSLIVYLLSFSVDCSFKTASSCILGFSVTCWQQWKDCLLQMAMADYTRLWVSTNCWMKWLSRASSICMCTVLTTFWWRWLTLFSLVSASARVQHA